MAPRLTARRPMLREGAADSVAKLIAALPDLPLDELKARWLELYGTPPPLRLGRRLMVRAIAHRLQENAFGGLRPATRRRLFAMAGEIAAGRRPNPVSGSIKPGTRLIRAWQGVTHEVIVLEQGIQYSGQTWRSLSAVARHITGARWSGPAFFGLKARNDDPR